MSGPPSGRRNDAEPVPVLLELRVSGEGGLEAAMLKARELASDGFSMDPDCECMCLPDAAVPGGQTYLVPGRIPPDAKSRLEGIPGVVGVWSDPPIDHLTDLATVQRVAATSGGCQKVHPCTCEKRLTGTIEQAAIALGADQLWDRGITGAGVVVGMVDGGITAAGRTISQDDLAHGWTPACAIPRVIGGYPGDWGTRGWTPWQWHGNMTARTVLGIAPDARLLDIRIADRVTQERPEQRVSGACQGYCWALAHHREYGVPHVLSNSWALWQRSQYADYAEDVALRHPLNRLVSQAVAEGIAVVFGAGNCGNECPPPIDKCGGDSGPGRAIWGANGHPGVMTVGAATLQREFIEYSSPGPAALHEEKPDFVTFSHFGSSNPDRLHTGTSASCAVAAGAVALLVQARAHATPRLVRRCLRETARRNGSSGFDPYWGYGVIDAREAYDLLCSLVLP